MADDSGIGARGGGASGGAGGGGGGGSGGGWRPFGSHSGGAAPRRHSIQVASLTSVQVGRIGTATQAH